MEAQGKARRKDWRMRRISPEYPADFESHATKHTTPQKAISSKPAIGTSIINHPSRGLFWRWKMWEATAATMDRPRKDLIQNITEALQISESTAPEDAEPKTTGNEAPKQVQGSDSIPLRLKAKRASQIEDAPTGCLHRNTRFHSRAFFLDVCQLPRKKCGTFVDTPTPT